MITLGGRITVGSVVVPGVTGVILTLAGAGAMWGWAPKVFMILLVVAGGQSRHWVKVLFIFFLVHFAVPPLCPGLGHGLEVLTGAATLPHCPHLRLPPWSAAD